MSHARSKVFTIKVILIDVFQCLVDEVHAPQSLWRDRETKILQYLINAPGSNTSYSLQGQFWLNHLQIATSKKCKMNHTKMEHYFHYFCIHLYIQTPAAKNTRN